MANIPRKSRRVHVVDRFLRRADRGVHFAHRVHRTWSRTAADRTGWRHGASDRGVGGSANTRGVPLGYGAALHDPGSGRGVRCRFRTRLKAMGIQDVVTAPRSPWQNPYAERVIGSVRRECLDHVIVLNEGHLRRILTSYLIYYHESRTRLSLAKDTPAPFSRPVPGRLWYFRNSVVCITATSDWQPERYPISCLCVLTMAKAPPGTTVPSPSLSVCLAPGGSDLDAVSRDCLAVPTAEKEVMSAQMRSSTLLFRSGWN